MRVSIFRMIWNRLTGYRARTYSRLKQQFKRNIGTEDGVLFFKTVYQQWKLDTMRSGMMTNTNWVSRHFVLEYRSWRTPRDSSPDDFLAVRLLTKQCMVCNEGYQRDDQDPWVTVLPCGHTSHRSCAARFLRWSAECVVCKADIDCTGREPNRLDTPLTDILRGEDSWLQTTHVIGDNGGFVDDDGNYVYYS